ncbi:MAG: sigma-70 family RNA polymerase sigma factor [Aureliella sp.]
MVDGSVESQADVLEVFREYMRQVARHALATKKDFKLSVSDIVQNAILSAHKDAQRCRAQNTVELKAWLRTIVLNDISNACRDAQRQKRDVRREKSIDTVVSQIDKQATPSEVAVRDEEQQRIEAALTQLPEDSQRVIRLRHQEDRSFVDIAKLMDRSPDAIRMLWNRSIVLLSRELKRTK